MRVGEFRCPPGDALWDEVNDNIGPEAHVVFPRTTVVLERERGGRLLSTPNHVVFYRPYERYRRALHDERGDVSVFVAYDGPVPDQPAGPLSARAYLLARRLPREDALAREETAAALVDEALGGAAGVRHAPAGQRIAEAAKELLLERFDQPLSLQALAADLHVSPFHLTRTFRAHTGYTLTRYVHELRLRAAVERMAEDREVDLTRLAHDLGYCSLAHFSERFSRAFGTPPSQVRNSMEAPAAAAA
jgi:AraC-like DNA-binding protein